MSNINFVSIQVKCPICGRSFMDAEHKVDNEQSIKLMIESKNQKGAIYLSSIYGSFNYISSIEVPQDEIVKFSCPHCRREVKSKENCDTCKAPMISLVLDMGGKVSFCSRKGCQSHNIGFDDLSVALKKLYQEFGYVDKSHPQEIFYQKDSEETKTEEEEHKEIIETGSFLHSYCPHCKKSLIETDMLKLKVINENNEEGFAMLSPYLNVFSLKSTVFLPEDKNIQDIQCYHCNKSLIIDKGKCEKCGESIVKILVSARTKMIDFYICSKKGCTWHGLSKKDMDDIRLEDSDEW
jgi:hypothetical protein